MIRRSVVLFLVAAATAVAAVCAGQKDATEVQTVRVGWAEDGEALKPKKGENGGRIRFALPVRAAGPHAIWVRHHQRENSYNALEFLVRDADGETIAYRLPERIPDLWVDAQAEGRVFAPTCPDTWRWTRVDVTFERPGEYRLELGRNVRYYPRGTKTSTSPLEVREVWLTGDLAANPERAPFVEADCPERREVPEGFLPARVHAPNAAALNTSIRDPLKRPPTSLVECYSWFLDPARCLKYGVTDVLRMDEPVGRDARRSGAKLERPGVESGFSAGVTVQVNADAYSQAAKILAKKYPFDPRKPVGPGNEPVGRHRWSDGTWSGEFSDAFEELRELSFELDKDLVRDVMTNNPAYPSAYCWYTAWENCGRFDYGPTSCEGFRKYLKERYGSLAALNAAWRTAYAGWDEVTPARWEHVKGPVAHTGEAWHRTAANFIDFRAFCSRTYALRVAQKTRAVRAHDTRTHISSNLSGATLAAVLWQKWRPLIYEDTAQITMKGADMIGYDSYGSDDFYGACYEMYDAFGDGRLRPMVREGSIHAPNAELMSRTMAHVLAKGMQGMTCFCLQECSVGELSKFGMTDMFHGAVPRPKLAAIADNFRAIHQLEDLVSATARVRAVKPVAIYYSPISNLMADRPNAGIFDCGPDNVFRVYELLHGAGYDVTFVTDRQIQGGGDWLRSLGAIVMVDAQYVPLETVAALEDWVRGGGSLLADAQCGRFDDHTYPTTRLTDFLGVRRGARAKATGRAAEALKYGYSSYAYDVVNSDELWNTGREVKDAPGGLHPISRRLDKTMFGTLGYQPIDCVKGTVVLQENNGGPFMVVRNEGKGTVAYFAGFLGAMYGAGLTRYEQSDAHADDSPYRVLDAWAAWAGLEKIEENDLADGLRYGMRFESPLVDAAGNATLGIVSQLRTSAPSFRVKYKMPSAFRAPKTVLAAVNSTRELRRVPFDWNAATRELSVRVPPIRCWANVLALSQARPLVSVAAVEARRDAYALAWLRPGDEVTYRVKVCNPSDRELPAGRVTLRLPDGWFYDRETAEVGTIPAQGESEEFCFRVRAPAFNSCRKLEPVNFVYAAGDVVSAPSVEMVWFQEEPQNAPPVSFGSVR